MIPAFYFVHFFVPFLPKKGVCVESVSNMNLFTEIE